MSVLREAAESYMSCLAAHGSRAPAQLLPGGAPEDVRAHIESVGLEPTDELVEFFSWQGGMGGDSLTLGQLWIMPGFLPLSITDAVQMYRLYADGPDWLPRWFPVFEDQAGWFYAYDLGEFRGAVVLFQHETGQYPYVFESLAAMFSTHRAALDRGAISVDSEGVLEQDYERLSAVAKELNPKVPWWSLPE